MNDSRSFHDLMNDLIDGDERAAIRIVNDHTAALVAVARREIGPKLRRRIDAEDVVQSAYRSFFARMGRGEYELGTGRELWKLLVTMTLNKIRRQGKHHSAGKRAIARDVSIAGSTDRPLENLPGTNTPSPEEAAMLVDELEAFLDGLNDGDREIVELRLQGLTSLQIAKETGRAERSVRRILERVQNGHRDL